jgi:UTP--glucose-1-phosphate uridylyltransferase
MLSNNHDDRPVELVRSKLAPPQQAPAAARARKDDTMATTIRKAVIPAAGLGSRLLPLTKAIPKEMLPETSRLSNTPCANSSLPVTDITIVVSAGKSLIQDHFRPNPGLVEQGTVPNAVCAGYHR